MVLILENQALKISMSKIGLDKLPKMCYIETYLKPLEEV
jgi:hypothetical protein